VKSSEIVLLTTLMLVGAFASALPSWPQQQPRTIVRLEPAAPRVVFDRPVERSDAIVVRGALERLPLAALEL
jgi:hypothetical protein